MRGGLLALVAAVCALTLAGPAAAYDSAREQRNYSKINERFLQEEANAEYQVDHLAVGLDNMLDVIGRDIREGDRFSAANLCASGFNGCAGDIRYYDYQGKRGFQIPLVFVNRNGAKLEGHLWISLDTMLRFQRTERRVTRIKCKRKRRKARRARCVRRKRALVQDARIPGVVIETGSVQAPERIYWWAAQTLAKHGYLAMTFDVQGQGRSDTFGEGDQMFEGVPAQQLQVFTDGVSDALDFFMSSNDAPYAPRDEQAAAHQAEEAEARRVTAFNPLHHMLDHERIGLVGHSLGASSVSTVQQEDTRVDAIVAWDNLNGTVNPRVPALGMSADYGLTPTPYGSDPDPEAKNRGFARWAEAGVDTMQVNVRGGTHYEWSFISNPAFGATLRGIDMSAWYTTAWLDKYVKGDPTADARLLTTRWHDDAPGKAIDPEGDGNLFSFYYRSRARLGGVACDDIRAGCPHLVADDGVATDPPYSALTDR